MVEQHRWWMVFGYGFELAGQLQESVSVSSCLKEVLTRLFAARLAIVDVKAEKDCDCGMRSGCGVKSFIFVEIGLDKVASTLNSTLNGNEQSDDGAG